jgi:uncharacterized phage-like protein YoqJ
LTKTVCFTGHRSIPGKDYARLYDLLQQTVEQLIRDGASIFRTGGALGFDTMAALCILNLRRQYPHIRLELILPCPTQTEQWQESDVLLYEQIMERADIYRYVSQSYYTGVLQMRNRSLVDGADVCVAYLRTSNGGGAAYTAAYALKQGLELVNLQDLL